MLDRSRPARLLAAILTLAMLIGVPVGAQEPAAVEPQDDRPVVELSLVQAVQMALRHNLQVKISSFAPQLSEENITSSRARFDPTVSFRVPQQFNRDTQQGTSALSGADVVTTERVSSGFAFNQTLTYGTDWSVNWTTTRSTSNNTFSNFNPNWSSNLALSVTQPLLRNFGREINESPIVIARQNYEVSREQFRDQVQGIMLQVYQAYWRLVFTARDLTVKELSLDLAQQQLERNRVQVEIGTLAPIETIQAERQVATNELQLTQAQQAVADAEDDLKRLINAEAATDVGWDVRLVPTADPEVLEEPIDVEEAIREAMENDPILRQRRIQLESRQLNVRVARNSLLPQLNFTGGITLSGQGGDFIIRGGGFGSSAILEVQEGGVSDSVTNLMSGDFRNWNVGLTLTVPINNWAAKAQHAQALINERQILTQIADREQLLRVDIIKAVRQVQSGARQVDQARTARELAERQLDAEQRKFAVGTTTNFEVLTFQRDLATAATQELQAMANYVNSLASLEQTKGTLLEALGVSIAMAGVPGPVR